MLVAEPPPVLTSTPDREGAPDPLEQLTYRPTTASGLFRVALQAGLLGVIANVIPLGLGMVLTGILAALLYHRAAARTLATAKAARLGAMAGAIAFAASSVFTGLGIFIFHKQEQFRQLIMNIIDERAAAAGPDAQTAIQWLHTPEGFAMMLAFSMVFALLLSMLFSAIGCVIGAVLFRERNRPTF